MTVLSPEDAVIRLLEHVGEDPTRDGLRATPRRVVRALEEMTAGYAMDPADILRTRFDVSHSGLITLQEIEFASLCEHHLLPLTGNAAVGYVPGDGVVGLSKLARLVHCFARRLQIQERMTDQIAGALMEHAGARGAGVIVRAGHTCMSCRGVRQTDARMVTSAMLGVLQEDAQMQARLWRLADG